MSKLNSLKYRLEQVYIRKYWIKQNKHNKTRLGRISNLEAISFIKKKGITVGKNTYGVINVNYTCGDKEKLKIGNNCSLGRCEFLLGGGHDYECLTTYPFNESAALSKGQIIVEDDVWIGDNVWVLSGVTINKGAVVGTGSIVTHDVPPYAIVAGNPAKIIKYRFSRDIIEKLLSFQLDIERLTEEQLNALGEHITSENVDSILKKLTD